MSSCLPWFHKNNVVGLLFVKDLIFIDPEDETSVSEFIEIFGRGVHVVWPDDKLGDVLLELKGGRSHMALVRDVNQSDSDQDPYYEIKGIITLEDIIEEILGAFRVLYEGSGIRFLPSFLTHTSSFPGQEIVDETDAFVDGSHSVKLDREDAFNFARLRLLNSKIVDSRLPTEEAQVVTAHLRNNYSHVVASLSDAQLHRLVSESPVVVYPTATLDYGKTLPSDLIYVKDDPIDLCTLILSGKVTVLVGVDQFRSDVSSWSLLGAGALENPNYVPDFSAFVSNGPCRCIRISRARFVAAVDASVVERTEIHRKATPPPIAPPNLEGKSTSRKTKLVTALQAIETADSNPDSSASRPQRTASSVVFAEPSALRQNSFVRVTSLLTSRDKISSSTTKPATVPSRFEFISAPSKRSLNDEDNASDKK